MSNDLQFYFAILILWTIAVAAIMYSVGFSRGYIRGRCESDREHIAAIGRARQEATKAENLACQPEIESISMIIDGVTIAKWMPDKPPTEHDLAVEILEARK